MQSFRSLAVLLLIGIGLCSVEGECVFNQLQRYCLCSTVDLNSVISIFPCISATIFEFQGGSFEELTGFSSASLQQIVPLVELPLTRVIFANVVLSENFLVAFAKAAYFISIRDLVFENCTFVGRASWQDLTGTAPQVFSLQFKNVSSNHLSGRASDISSVSSWMAQMQDLTLVQSQITHIPCNISTHFKALTYLDLSANPLQDQGIVESFCDGLFPTLEVLRLHHSHLTSLEEICTALLHLDKLKDLDLSENNFSHPASSYSCVGLQALGILNLSDTGLSSVNISFPPNIEILDLSWNRLHTLDISLSRLKEVHLSNNALKALPSPESFPVLEVLSADGNMIDHLHKHHLQSFRHLRTFRAERNPYICSCSSLMEMRDLVELSFEVEGWPSGYICDSPALHRGTPMNDVQLSAFDCHKPLLVGLICVLILVVCIAGIICWVKTRCCLRRAAQGSQGESRNVHFHT